MTNKRSLHCNQNITTVKTPTTEFREKYFCFEFEKPLRIQLGTRQIVEKDNSSIMPDN